MLHERGEQQHGKRKLTVVAAAHALLRLLEILHAVDDSGDAVNLLKLTA
jgi:hypothetical protein